jgi:elongation factor G
LEFEFISNIKGGAIPKEYIPGVKKGIESILANGIIAGFPVVGVKAILYDGAFHDVDSSVMAFEIAGRDATKQGLKKAKARLMEPWMKVDVTTPEQYMGDVLGDMNSRRGIVSELTERGNVKVVSAMIPLANMFSYVSVLRSISKGRASYSMKLANYDFVPHIVEEEIKNKMF